MDSLVHEHTPVCCRLYVGQSMDLRSRVKDHVDRIYKGQQRDSLHYRVAAMTNWFVSLTWLKSHVDIAFSVKPSDPGKDNSLTAAARSKN